MWPFWTSFWWTLYLVGSIILLVIGSPISVCVSWTLTVAPVPTPCCSLLWGWLHSANTVTSLLVMIIRVVVDDRTCICQHIALCMVLLVWWCCQFVFSYRFLFTTSSVIQVNVIFTIWNDFSCDALFVLDGLYVILISIVLLWQALDVSCRLS